MLFPTDIVGSFGKKPRQLEVKIKCKRRRIFGGRPAASAAWVGCRHLQPEMQGIRTLVAGFWPVLPAAKPAGGNQPPASSAKATPIGAAMHSL